MASHPQRTRGTRSARGRTQPRKATAKTTATGHGFHAPSFSGGVLLGAALVLTMAYLPELTTLGRKVAAERQRDEPKTQATAAEQALTFEFEEILASTAVTPESGAYASPDDALDLLYLQAASFRTQDEANRLRADLLLLDLPAQTAPVELSNGRWIRVTVGPFASATDANRAMTALRQRDIAPIWIKRKNTG
ncbi:MAG: SPOR domain-containing protein [Pseudomonadota bacterium]